MKKGDLLLVQSKYDPIGWFIRLVTKSEWNHVAWVIDACHVLEVKGRQVKTTHINYYQDNKNYKIKLVRIKYLKKSQIKLAIDRALKFQKKSNYFLWLYTIILILFKYKGKLPRFTCSGLIAHSLNKEGYKFKKNILPRFISPENILNGKNVDNVSTDLHYYSGGGE